MDEYFAFGSDDEEESYVN